MGFDAAVDLLVVSLMLSRCIRIFPALSNITPLRTWTGFRPYTGDLLPIISPVGSISGLCIAAGHEGIGITEGHITDKLISQMITGHELTIKVERLSLCRFAKQKRDSLGSFYRLGARIRTKDEVSDEKQDSGCLRSGLYRV